MVNDPLTLDHAVHFACGLLGDEARHEIGRNFFRRPVKRIADPAAAVPSGHRASSPISGNTPHEIGSLSPGMESSIWGKAVRVVAVLRRVHPNVVIDGGKATDFAAALS